MIILIGPSASGKTEIAKCLYSLFGYKKFVTTTTRDKRVNEIDGKDYYFISKDQFLECIKENKFIEYTTYNSNYYGSFKSENGEDKVLIVEPNGLTAFNNLRNKKIVSFYIDSEENERYKRMLARGDKIEDIEKRIENDRKIFNKNLPVDYIIENKNSTLEELSRKVNELYLKKIN